MCNPYSNMTIEKLGYEISAMKREHYDTVQELKRLRSISFPTQQVKDDIYRLQFKATCLHDDIEEAEEEQCRKTGVVPKKQHEGWRRSGR